MSLSKKHDVSKDYTFDKELGSGGYGTVYLAYHNESGEKRAIKTIKKSDVEDASVFKHEINILMSMDHPNIIKLYDCYETDDFVYLVTDCCEGGELFYYITKAKHVTEAEAAKIMRQIFSAIAYCHKNNVCHRDLKPENFLLKTDGDPGSIKLIDFGLARRLAEGEKLTTPNGTPYYLAPEIVKGEYNTLVDNWSLGIVMYVMLSGCPPFYGKNNKEILKSIVSGVYTFNLKPFKTCSDEVKDLISKLLVVDPAKRFTAEQSYNHPWVQRQVDADCLNIEISPAVIENMAKFVECQHLKKTVCYMIAQQLPEEDIQEFKQMFVKLDKNGDGFLSREEFKDVFQELGSRGSINVPEEELDGLYSSLDLNGSGRIDYTEFLAAFTNNEHYKKEKYLVSVFKKIDKDGNNKITKSELEAFYNREIQYLNDDQLIACIEECDYNGDGVIDYNELLSMMKGKRGK